MTHARVMTLVQWAQGTDWRLALQHACPDPALVWITRGQGLAIVEGVRRGLGVHNALVLPAGTMFSLETGKTGFGLVCEIPRHSAAPMPDSPHHLRIRDVTGQNELTLLFEAMSREQNDARPFASEVLDALAAQMSVWLRRALIAHPEEPRPPAAERLVRAYAALIERHLGEGLSVADHARDLIETTERPMADIAASLGFGSAAYFSRFILHHTGHTPSQLRSAARARLRTKPAL
jgi:AraC family transcriptional activator of pobA